MTDSRVLYLIACAAPPALRIRTGIEKAQRAGWDVCLVLTPSAARWLGDEMPDLAALTGRPVRTAYKLPQEADVFPPPDAVLVAPATFNTINKWAQGIADTLALGLITEAIGLHLPVVALPHVNQAQAANPALHRSVEFLRANGVTVLHEPEHGDADAFPWDTALTTLP